MRVKRVCAGCRESLWVYKGGRHDRPSFICKTCRAALRELFNHKVAQ